MIASIVAFPILGNYGRPTIRGVSHELRGAEDVGEAWCIQGACAARDRGVVRAQTATERANIELPDGTRRDAVVEPSTRYVVGRVTRDFEEGASAVGAMFTSVHRSFPSGDSSSLPATAVFAGLDARRRSRNGDYEASGFLSTSVVEGSAASMPAVEQSAAHYLLRPDAAHLRDFVNDSMHTSLTGASAQVRVAKLGGGHWRWSVIGQSISPAFEVNDVGFQRNSDWRIALGTLHFVQYHPGPLFRTWTLGIDQLGAGWSFGGERRAAVGTVARHGSCGIIGTARRASGASSDRSPPRPCAAGPRSSCRLARRGA